jgi:hypothetical protein
MNKDSNRSSEIERLRADIGEDLWQKYFPGDKTQNQKSKEAEDAYEASSWLRERNTPSWKKKKVDTTDWNI